MGQRVRSQAPRTVRACVGSHFRVGILVRARTGQALYFVVRFLRTVRHCAIAVHVESFLFAKRVGVGAILI
jgi:hypothetical protein